MPVTLAEARALALSLPESTEAPHFDYTSFRVRGKIFATAPPGGEVLHVFVGEDVREPALAVHDDCLEKLPWGARIVGLRVFLARAPEPLVHSLLRQAWAGKAPRALLRDPPPPKPARRKR
jgi:hypothetical protein